MGDEKTGDDEDNEEEDETDGEYDEETTEFTTTMPSTTNTNERDEDVGDQYENLETLSVGCQKNREPFMDPTEEMTKVTLNFASYFLIRVAQSLQNRPDSIPPWWRALLADVQLRYFSRYYSSLIHF